METTEGEVLKESMADPPQLSARRSLKAYDCLPSPITELTQCFTGLSAFHTGDTPRRCLDLSNISTGSADGAVPLGSPYSERHTDQPAVPLDSPAPRKDRMQRLRSFLPRLLCSSPKAQQGGHVQRSEQESNKENVAAWVEQNSVGSSHPHGALDGFSLASPISPTPGFVGNKEADGFMEVLEDQENSATVSLSSSMAQLLSDPLMNQDVNLSSVTVSRKAGRRLFRSPSMPERLNRAVLKRTRQSPAQNPPLKRHRTFSAISEENEEELKGDDPAMEGAKKSKRLLKKTLSLCEVAQHLGGDSVSVELIGDFSKVYALPTVTGRHQDLKYITGETMCALLNGEFSSLVESFVVLDCRYPYEYQAGHIKGAMNMPNTNDAVEHLLREQWRPCCPDKRLLLVFHCEFSSERAPRTCRLLRRDDRSLNEYPALHYPELYILKGGYRDFFHAYKEHCEPQSYCPMHHEDHKEELLQFRTHSRASADERRRRQHITRYIKL